MWCQRNLRNSFAFTYMQVPWGYPRAQFTIRGLCSSRDGFVSHQLSQRQWLFIWFNVSRLAMSAGGLNLPGLIILDDKNKHQCGLWTIILLKCDSFLNTTPSGISLAFITSFPSYTLGNVSSPIMFLSVQFNMIFSRYIQWPIRTNATFQRFFFLV